MQESIDESKRGDVPEIGKYNSVFAYPISSHCAPSTAGPAGSSKKLLGTTPFAP